VVALQYYHKAVSKPTNRRKRQVLRCCICHNQALISDQSTSVETLLQVVLDSIGMLGWGNSAVEKWTAHHCRVAIRHCRENVGKCWMSFVKNLVVLTFSNNSRFDKTRNRHFSIASLSQTGTPFLSTVAESEQNSEAIEATQRIDS
jgi:hypothetical protein